MLRSSRQRGAAAAASSSSTSTPPPKAVVLVVEEEDDDDDVDVGVDDYCDYYYHESSSVISLSSPTESAVVDDSDLDHHHHQNHCHGTPGSKNEYRHYHRHPQQQQQQPKSRKKNKSSFGNNSSNSNDDDDDDRKGKKQHRHNKQRRRCHRNRHRRRSVMEEIRYCVITGRCSRIVYTSVAFVLFGVASYIAHHQFVDLMITCVSSSFTFNNNNSNNNNNNHRPVMITYPFNGIATTSFVGFDHVQSLVPPQHSREWMVLLTNHRHQYSHGGHNNDHGHDHYHHDMNTHAVLPKVQPLSDPRTYNSIVEDSEDYEDSKPEFTTNPEQCVPQHRWQISMNPVCNNIHEIAPQNDRLVILAPSVDDNDEEEEVNDYNHRHRHHHHHRNKLRRRLPIPQSTPSSFEQEHHDQQYKHHHPSQPQTYEQYRVLAHGYWRDTWKYDDKTQYQLQSHGTSTANANTPTDTSTTTVVAMKTIRYEHDVTEYLLDKQRRDAVTSDRVAASGQVVHMYSYCGTTALYEYAPGGDLEVLIEKFDTAQDFVSYFPIEERYTLAYNVSLALRDVHTTEGLHRPVAIVHGDFKADQFVATTSVYNVLHDYLYDEEDENEDSNEDSNEDGNEDNNQDEENENGEREDDHEQHQRKQQRPKRKRRHKLPHYKLGDFNLARMVYWNSKYDHPCVIRPDGNGGEFRAPEEYANQHGRTEKVDIYSLGNLLYTILTGHWPFDDIEHAHGTKELKHLVKHGVRPHVNIDADYRNSKDPLIQTLLQAIELCWKQDPHERASAYQIEQLLKQHINSAIERIDMMDNEEEDEEDEGEDEEGKKEKDNEGQLK